MAENRAKHRARFDRGQGQPRTPFPSPLQRNKTEPDVSEPFFSGVTGFGGSVLRGNPADKVFFATVRHPGLPSQLFFQLINKLWAFLNLWRAGACCMGLGLNSFTSAHGQYSGCMDLVYTVPLGRHSGSHGHPWKGRPTRGTPSESSYLPLPGRASADLG